MMSQEVKHGEPLQSVRIPSFVSDWPSINPADAALLALKVGLVKDETDPRAAASGLRLCRDHQITAEEGLMSTTALAQAQRIRKDELPDAFPKPPAEKDAIIVSERVRITRRDTDILTFESDILQRRNIPFPVCGSLHEYGEWLAQSGPCTEGINPEIVVWDLLRHYALIMEGVRMAFDPAAYFYEMVAQGRDPSYYADFMMRGGVKETPSHHDYPSRLVTHTRETAVLPSILARGFLEPRPKVCLAAGQVVFGYVNGAIDTFWRVTFIFDRKELEQLYHIFPYTDQDEGYEKEIRLYELVHTGLAIGCLPTASLNYQIDHWGNATIACGRGLLRQWEQRYQQTGKLWKKEELVQW